MTCRVRRESKSESSATMVQSSQQKPLGVGAVVSFESKLINPPSLREQLGEHPSGHRLTDAVIVRREEKLVNDKPTSCVIVTHADFTDENGQPQELCCAESAIKVHKEGDNDKFFDAVQGNQGQDSDADRDDVENPNKVNNQHRRQSIDPSGFDDPLRPREGRNLMWRNVNMTLMPSNKTKKKNQSTVKPHKKILDNVWGDVPSKHVTAIMGPSGSGKTSLLNVLAGRAATNGNIVIQSDIRLNNYSVDPTQMEVRNQIAFVAQDDSLQITATPREAIRFSAKMRLPKTMSEEALDNLTEIMLDELGLQSCADVLVGGALLKGVSGGERKRTSVGVELVTQPQLV